MRAERRASLFVCDSGARGRYSVIAKELRETNEIFYCYRVSLAPTQALVCSRIRLGRNTAVEDGGQRHQWPITSCVSERESLPHKPTKEKETFLPLLLLFFVFIIFFLPSFLVVTPRARPLTLLVPRRRFPARHLAARNPPPVSPYNMRQRRKKKRERTAKGLSGDLVG